MTGTPTRKEDLRPIGTIYTSVGYDHTGTDSRRIKRTYEVVGHFEVDYPPGWGEQIKCIDMKCLCDTCPDAQEEEKP